MEFLKKKRWHMYIARSANIEKNIIQQKDEISKQTNKRY
jgi:hypothetical protein